MDILYPRCAGLEIRKRSLLACILLPDTQGHPSKQFHSFSSTLFGLQSLRQLLTSLGVTHVAMKNSGVFWKDIYNVLEGHVTL
jgi:transposase